MHSGVLDVDVGVCTVWSVDAVSHILSEENCFAARCQSAAMAAMGERYQGPGRGRRRYLGKRFDSDDRTNLIGRHTGALYVERSKLVGECCGQEGTRPRWRLCTQSYSGAPTHHLEYNGYTSLGMSPYPSPLAPYTTMTLIFSSSCCCCCCWCRWYCRHRRRGRIKGENAMRNRRSADDGRRANIGWRPWRSNRSIPRV